MEMTPLWKIASGHFAGWYTSDALYDAQGTNIGYLAGMVGYSRLGKYLGEVYKAEWIGRRADGHDDSPPVASAHHENVAHAPLPDRAGLSLNGWSDPDF